MIAPRPDYPLDYDWLAENITTRELAEIIACDVSSANGDKLQCHCSNHPDGNPSCTIDRVDGRTVVHCFGCKLSGSPVQAAAIVWGMEEPEAARQLRNELLALRNGTRVSSSRPVPSATSAQIGGESPKPNLTLEEYSKAKRLRKESVEYHGVQEELRHGGTVLAFRCRDLKGNIVAIRYRLWMEAPEGRSAFEQEPGKPVYPFGVNKIPGWLNSVLKTKIVLVEGESDAMTMWANGYPAIGIPGAGLFKEEWADLVTGFESVFVWREHGEAAHQFVKKIGAAIPDALVLHDEDHDDPSSLYLAVNGDGKKSKKMFAKLIDAARPISDVIREIDIQQVVVKSGPWGEPILPDSAPDIDPYPTFDLPHSLYRFVEEVAEGVQVSSDMVLMAVISTVSACVAGKAQVGYNDWAQPLQLWTATVADSGTGKSPAFRFVSAPVKTWEAEKRESTKTERAIKRSRKASLKRKLEALERKASGQSVAVGSQEWQDIIQAQADIRKELEDYPSVAEPRMIAEDSTPEALVRVMSDNDERIFVGSSEADVLKILGGMYSNQANTALWKAGYDSIPYTYDRVRDTTSIRLDRPALAATIMLQPVVMQTLRNKEVLLGEGLLGRFFYAVPKSNRGYRKTGQDVSPPDPAVLGEYERRIKTLLNLPFPDKKKALPLLEFTQDATQLLYDLEDEFEKEAREDGVLEAVPDWGNKLFGKTLRLAGVLHLFEAAQHGSLSLVGGGTISEAMVQAAGDLARAAIPHALTSYGMLGKDERMETLEYVFKRYKTLLKSGDPVTKRDLFQAVKNKPALRKRVSSLDSYIDDLEERDVLRQVNTTGIGRPSVVLIPNPDIVSEVTKKGLTGTNSGLVDGASGSFDPFDPVSGGRKENITDSHDRSSDPFETVNGEENDEEKDTAGDSHGTSGPFDTLNSRVEGEKIESTGELSEKIGSSESPQEKIQPPEGEEPTSDTLGIQSQKDQNSSTPDEPDSLPPTTELF